MIFSDIWDFCEGYQESRCSTKTARVHLALVVELCYHSTEQKRSGHVHVRLLKALLYTIIIVEQPIDTCSILQ